MQLSPATITFIETWVELLDTKIGAGSIRVGIDPLFSFLPGVGAFIPAIFTFGLALTAIVVRAPLRVILLILGYMCIDLLISAVPFAGIPLDALFHANAKSWYLLKPYVTISDEIDDNFPEKAVIVEGEVIE